MNILVLNGSPKGDNSITLQTVKYLEIVKPGHSWEVLHVGARIRAYEKDFAPAKAALEKAELILFVYPVYTFIAPYQMHRFIELMKAAGVNVAGKFASQISTSKHFYDVTAQRYIQDNAQDLGLKYIRGLSADMDDLTTQKGRQEAEKFWDYVCWCCENGVSEPVPVKLPAGERHLAEVPADSNDDKPGNVVIVTDCEKDNLPLQQMIDGFRAVFPRKTRVVNIREYPFRGGCLGCFNCAVSGKCIYTDKFDAFLREEIQSGESIVDACSVKDHSMGAAFKLYDDRQFCNGHRTVTMGMPMGYLISGDYSREMNLQTIVEGRAQVGGNFLAGVATDEGDVNAAVDRMAAALNYALENQYAPPQNFLGVGGMKVFRDLIWLMQGMMKADHKFYKAHGQYDFPQKKWPRMLAMYLVGAMMSSEKLKKKAGGKMTEGMLMPYTKVLKEAREKHQQ